jgi:adenosylcobinamide-GDP ribazoletransferase
MPTDTFPRWSSVHLAAAARFLTTLRMRGAHVPLAATTPFFPLVGIAVGCCGSLVYLFDLPPLLAAMLALAVTALVTGALHEDGLADTADGLGGGRDRENALAIMRDSRSGAFGVLALVFSVGLRAAALAAMPTVGDGIRALIAAHAVSRGLLPAVMHHLDPARADGLGASAGRPDGSGMLWALALGVGIAVLALGFDAILATIVAALLVAALAGVARRRLGGYTGDVLGAAQQLAEIAILLIAAAR